MDNSFDTHKILKVISLKQKNIVKSLYLSPQKIIRFIHVKNQLLNLQSAGILEVNDDEVFLTELGISIGIEISDSRSSSDKEESLKSERKNQARTEKSKHFLELYKEGLTYQNIGDRYNLSRERVRQVLDKNPDFHVYLKEREAKIIADECELKERKKQDFLAKSILGIYPNQVSELWDFQKNGELSPAEVPAGSTQHYVWFKCPVDGHSWQKKPNDISTSWTRSGTSGCPACAGKNKKAEKQPAIIDSYPELVNKYWDFERNNLLNLDPKILTLASNKKVWFKCPEDNTEWQSTIVSTISQQWSKGNAGCRTCNGTAERKRGEWQRREPLTSEFPDKVAKYWLYEANNELGLDPTKLTLGSGKEAFFKCPIDGHEWVAKIALIARVSWKKGNSGCPACRGFTTTDSNSLISTHPDRIAQYWDYEKNNKLGIYPNKLTRGSNQGNRILIEVLNS